MPKFNKYLFFIFGTDILFDFFSTFLSCNSSENYKILSFETSKAGYLNFKFTIGSILIIAGIREMKSEDEIS